MYGMRFLEEANGQLSMREFASSDAFSRLSPLALVIEGKIYELLSLFTMLNDVLKIRLLNSNFYF